LARIGLRVVAAEVAAAAFGAVEGGARDQARRCGHVAHVGVGDVCLLELRDGGEGCNQVSRVAFETDVQCHRHAQLRHGGAVRRCTAGRGLVIGVLVLVAVRDAFHILRRAGAKDHRFEQRVGGEPVCAVRAGRGALADGPQAFEARARLLVNRDAAHVVVRGGGDGDRLRAGVDARRYASREHRREFF
jgi:hypothetical protein